MLYPTTLTTLEAVKQLRGTDLNTDDPLFRLFVRSSGRMIEEYDQRSFVEWRQARAQDWHEYSIMLDADLLSITSVVDGGGTLLTTDYITQPANEWPKFNLTRVRGHWRHNGVFQQSITVTGSWGYHLNPALMWANTTTLNGAITNTATSITVTSAANIGTYDYIQVGTEIMWVSNIAGNVLTVQRGDRGSTAAAHDSGVTVQVFQVLSDIRHVATTLADFLWQNKDSYGESVAAIDGAIVIEKQAPQFVRDTLMRYRRTAMYTPDWP
jgi:hypothetical protein